MCVVFRGLFILICCLLQAASNKMKAELELLLRLFESSQAPFWPYGEKRLNSMALELAVCCLY